MLTEQWSVKRTIKLGRSLFTNQILTTQPKLTSISLVDIFKFKTKNLHAIPFVQRVKFIIPLEPWPAPRKCADAGLSSDLAELVMAAKLH